MEDAEFESVEAHDVDRISADAVGEPGRRRFRILVLMNGETTIAWMEKEQVRRLAELFIEIAERLPERPGLEEESTSLLPFNPETDQQFRAGRMELSYDEEDDRIIVLVYDIEADDDQPASVVCRVSRRQARAFSEEAAQLMATGRPLCPLCGLPMGPEPHVCEKQNGHFPERLGSSET